MNDFPVHDFFGLSDFLVVVYLPYYAPYWVELPFTSHVHAVIMIIYSPPKKLVKSKATNVAFFNQSIGAVKSTTHLFVLFFHVVTRMHSYPGSQIVNVLPRFDIIAILLLGRNWLYFTRCSRYWLSVKVLPVCIYLRSGFLLDATFP